MIYFSTYINNRLCLIAAKNKKIAQSNLTKILGYKYNAIFKRISKANFGKLKEAIVRERQRQEQKNCWIF